MKLLTLFVILFYFTTISNAGILNDLEINACKNNPACFICIEPGTNSLAYCDNRAVYDIALQKANPAKISQLCSLPTQKEQCRQELTNYDNIDNKGFNTEISTDKNFKRKTGDFGSRQWEWSITNNGNDIIVIVHRRTKGTGGRGYSDENRSFTLTSKSNESVPESQVIIDGDTSNPLSIGQSRTIGWDYNPEIVLNINYKIKTILSGYKYTCLSNTANLCMEENGAYYCNKTSCANSKDLQISTSDNATQDDLQGDYTSPNTCGLENAEIFKGRYLSCRHGSATTPLKNCCKSVEPNEELQKGLKYGMYMGTLFNPYLIMATALGELMDLFGESNMIKEWIEAATSWLSGGICEDGEISLSTLKASGPNDGNCIKLGEICSDYRGAWGNIMNKCWYTEIQCDRVAEVYCCFDDMMAKSTAKAARVQLGIGWGTDADGNKIVNANSIRPGGNPCNPDKKRYNFDCRGITIPEMVSLNLNTEEYRNDIRDYAEHLLSKLVDKDGQPIGKLQEIINDDSLAEKLKDSFK